MIDTDFSGEGTVWLVEDVLGGDFETGFEVFTGEEEVECWWCDNDLCDMLVCVCPCVGVK